MTNQIEKINTVYNKFSDVKVVFSKLQRKLYESKKARDILDEEFTEFLPIKRSTNEFFNLYKSKFYKISDECHKFFSEQSLRYIVDYINPKKIQEQELIKQINQSKIDIGSIEKHHLIFPNNTVLKMGTNFYLMQSGKRRKIIGSAMLQKVKDNFRKSSKITKNWTISVPTNTIEGIIAGPHIEKEEDLKIPFYTINTGKKLPSDIYTINNI